MIEAGNCFCPVCGQISDFAYYNSGTSVTGAVLHKSAVGREKYSVTPYDTNDPKNPCENIRMKLLFADSVSEWPPESIEVETTVTSPIKTTKTESFVRSCPKCKRQTSLFKDQGMLPTYVVAVIGKRGGGKSTWMHSLSTTTNTLAVNEHSYMCSVQPWKIQANSDVTAPTELNTLGKTTKMTLICEGTPFADVLFVDTAGELFDKKYEDAPFAPETAAVLRAADAFVIIDPADGDEDDAIRVFNRMQRGDYFKGKLVAYVMSKLDMLIPNDKKNRIESGSEGLFVPLVTKDTFPVLSGAAYTRSYDAENMIPRWALENTIVHQRSKLINIIDDSITCHGFLIKTCSDIYDGMTLKCDFRSPINAMDPFIWILNKLGVFPLKAMKGDSL